MTYNPGWSAHDKLRWGLTHALFPGPSRCRTQVLCKVIYIGFKHTHVLKLEKRFKLLSLFCHDKDRSINLSIYQSQVLCTGDHRASSRTVLRTQLLWFTSTRSNSSSCCQGTTTLLRLWVEQRPSVYIFNTTPDEDMYVKEHWKWENTKTLFLELRITLTPAGEMVSPQPLPQPPSSGIPPPRISWQVRQGHRMGGNTAPS